MCLISGVPIGKILDSFTFKDRWGAKRSDITYLRLLPPQQSKAPICARRRHLENTHRKKAFPCLPDRVLCAAGD